jgi:hypothetical protein
MTWTISISQTWAGRDPDGAHIETIEWWTNPSWTGYDTALDAVRSVLTHIRSTQESGLYLPEPIGWAVHRVGEQPPAAGILWEDEITDDMTAESIAAAIVGGAR